MAGKCAPAAVPRAGAAHLRRHRAVPLQGVPSLSQWGMVCLCLLLWMAVVSVVGGGACVRNACVCICVSLGENLRGVVFDEVGFGLCPDVWAADLHCMPGSNYIHRHPLTHPLAKHERTPAFPPSHSHCSMTGGCGRPAALQGHMQPARQPVHGSTPPPPPFPLEMSVGVWWVGCGWGYDVE
jgi:hypothetical protein